MHVGKKFPSIFANPLIMREALHEKNFFIKLFYMQDILASHATHSSQSANNTNLPDSWCLTFQNLQDWSTLILTQILQTAIVLERNSCPQRKLLKMKYNPAVPYLNKSSVPGV